MRRHLGLLRLLVGFAIQAQLEYRADILAILVTTLLSAGSAFLALYALFAAMSGEVAGWSFAQGIALYGVAEMIVTGIEAWLYPNLNPISERIRRGDFDFILLKPASSQFLISVSALDIWQLPGLLIGFGAVLYGMAASDALSIGNLALFLALFASGLALLYAIYLGLSTLAFWFTRVEEVVTVVYLVSSIGYMPVAAFPRAARFMLTFIVPVFFITNVPAQAATGILAWPWALGGIFAGLFGLWFSAWLWRRALGNYTSASS